ncbi:MAG: hypothetical protein NC453_16610 [Muribaculum sp.]|nr:hypothetical protein [Muribaculum sp.]
MITKVKLKCLRIAYLMVFLPSIVAFRATGQETGDTLVRQVPDSILLEVYSKKYSAVNPALFGYTSDDVYLCSPSKFDNGKNIIVPDIEKYPWEARLENGMPNVVVTEHGDVSIYCSSFIAFAAKPPSKVGALVYVNQTNDYRQPNWVRPDAGLYWYNGSGQTSDEKIIPSPIGSSVPTNIVATDIESLGIYDEYDVSKNGIKLIYLPQRESHNQIISAYQMNKTFTSQSILAGFSDMKNDRIGKQVNFTFDFINGDTHMGMLKVSDHYSFVSRVNAKRSYIEPDEQVPFKPDHRKRYRRETITPIGHSLVSLHVPLDVALDMSTPQWEPYSMQPFQMAGYENDIWYGLVTMFGTEGDPDVAAKQRTELAISNDGFHWRYLKPGFPFLDNGTDPKSDDYGCINIAIPVNNTKYSNDRDDLYYFYAASNGRHVAGRNPGISLAFGKRGKWAALSAGASPKTYTSSENPEFVASRMGPTLSLYNALFLGSSCSPRILADVTEDPTGKTLSILNSYVSVVVYALENGKKGALLTANLGKPKDGTTIPSDKYESASFTYQGKDASSKYYLIKYFSDLSKRTPNEIISMKDMDPIRVTLESSVKNANFYGIKYDITKEDAKSPLDIVYSNLFQPSNIWFHEQTTAGSYFTKDFKDEKLMPNETPPVCMETGTIAIAAQVGTQNGEQTLLNIYGDNNNNNMNIIFDSHGDFVYTLNKDGKPFAQMTVSPPAGQTFSGKDVSITIESVHRSHRKYGADIEDQVTLFRVSCPELKFEKIVPQPIIWNWKHEESQITESDRANAQCFAFLEFTSFIPSVHKVSVGSMDEKGTSKFQGLIKAVQFAPTLPEGTSDFWHRN